MRFVAYLLSMGLPVAPLLAQGSLPPGWIAKTETVAGLKQGQTTPPIFVLCPAGTKVTGGGYASDSIDREFVVIESGPRRQSALSGWEVVLRNTGKIERNVTVDVIAGCM